MSFCRGQNRTVYKCQTREEGRDRRQSDLGRCKYGWFSSSRRMQWGLDMNLTTILGDWAGLYLDGQTISQANLQPYVDSGMDNLEFLLGGSSIVYGTKRASLVYLEPFATNTVWVQDRLENLRDL
ncbi:hypothetical protein OIDMADRAFT_32662 [Oidiodendron maius Zn]|uniref:Alpha-L-arabinofuranosidase 1 catalytic domain-containing protein n=1 Tax=Oidiodendron maius (strain Zn) TaxID=913774 RepID=A0A0C3D485_OIDMZ|nr:hypothetical protein OIDMADRAFT_32662 [Oidiodendron maius Zn]